MFTLSKTDGSAWEYKINYALLQDFNFLWIGCSHIDSFMFAEKRARRIIEEALCYPGETRIILVGDNNDGMQGRNDPRRSRKAMIAEGLAAEKDPDLQGLDYANYMIAKTVKFLRPYAEHLDVMLLGNHELSIKKNMGVDVTKLVADQLSAESGHQIYRGGLEGFVRAKFYYKTKGAKSYGSKLSKVIHFRHDGGSCGKRSKGILAYDLLAAEYQNSDVFITAHTHDMLAHETKNTILDPLGKFRNDSRIYLQCPSFKESWKNPNKDGWWEATNKGARAVGAWLLRYHCHKGHQAPVLKTRYEFLR